MTDIARIPGLEERHTQQNDKINEIVRVLNALVAQVGGISVGEVNTASNVGLGAGVFKAKTGVDLAFRTIIGTGLAGATANADDVTLDVPIASQAEAEAGSDNTKAMTALRTAEAIAQLSPAGLTQLATGSLTGATFGFTGLSQAYSALVIVWTGLSTDSASGRPIGRYSVDNGATYASVSGDYHTAQNGAAPTATTSINVATGASAAAATCSGVIIIPGYALAAIKLAQFINVSTETADSAAGFCLLTVATAINAFRLETVAGSFDAGTLTIYGMK